MRREKVGVRATRVSTLLCIFIISVLNLHAQKISISTNALNYVNLVTLNAEVGYSLDKNWSVFASGKYNPFSFSSNRNGKGDADGRSSATKTGDSSENIEATSDDFINKQATMSVGAKYWPWHVYSGFYYGAKFQYSMYNQGGIISPLTEEGNAYGLGVNFGYSLLISRFINIEFGVGVWMGGTSFTQYACPTCGRVVDKGKKAFILPNDALLSLVFTF